MYGFWSSPVQEKSWNYYNAWFTTEEPSYWPHLEGYMLSILVEWFSWPPITYFAYCFAVMLASVITYESAKWAYNKYYQTRRHAKRIEIIENDGLMSPDSSMVSAHDLLPAPVPDKVWGPIKLGTGTTNNVQAQVDRKVDESGLRSSQPSSPQQSHRPTIRGLKRIQSSPDVKCQDCFTKQFKRVEFRYIGKAKKVFLTGNFLKWTSMVEMTPVLDGFFVCIDLPKGHYEYKFQVDGKWCLSNDDLTTTSLTGEILNVIHNL